MEKIQGKFFFRSFINSCVFITVWDKIIVYTHKELWYLDNTKSRDYGELNFPGFHCFKKIRLCLVPENFEGKCKEKKIVRESKKERKKMKKNKK